MAAFSFQHQPSLHDPTFLPNSSAFSQEPNTTPTTNCFSQFYRLESPQQIPVDVCFHESSCLEDGTKVGISHNNEPSVTNKHSTDSSSMVDKSESGEQVTQKVIVIAKKRKSMDGSSITSLQSMEAREVKSSKEKRSNGTITTMTDEKVIIKKPKDDKQKDQKKVRREEVPNGYNHVRAKRGQATDSHSLAERVRREKISERMKQLQALVPGCDKGHAKRTLSKLLWKVVPLAVLWSIWKHRNECVFNGAQPNLEELCEVVKVRIALWAQSSPAKMEFSINDVVFNLPQVQYCIRNG